VELPWLHGSACLANRTKCHSAERCRQTHKMLWTNMVHTRSRSHILGTPELLIPGRAPEEGKHHHIIHTCQDPGMAPRSTTCPACMHLSQVFGQTLFQARVALCRHLAWHLRRASITTIMRMLRDHGMARSTTSTTTMRPRLPPSDRPQKLPPQPRQSFVTLPVTEWHCHLLRSCPKTLPWQEAPPRGLHRCARARFQGVCYRDCHSSQEINW